MDEHHVMIEALDGAGRAVAVDMSIEYNRVEGWAGDRCRAVFDRGALRAWLATPSGNYAVDEMTWGCTEHRVAMTVAAVVPRWELSPRDLERLREFV